MYKPVKHFYDSKLNALSEEPDNENDDRYDEYEYDDEDENEDCDDPYDTFTRKKHF